MMKKPNLATAPKQPEPAWVRWWREHPQGKPVQHIEPKGKVKLARRERRRRARGDDS